jgi:3-hydroxybutyryl-CoA dehydratase
MSEPGEKLPQRSIRITQAMIDAYAELSGDFNPIHVDPAAAARTPFGGTIAHGCIPLEPIFQAVARWSGRETLPEDSALRVRYRAPSRPGDVVTSKAETKAFEPIGGRQRVTIAFTLRNQRDETVADGECEVTI